jgi:putative salt-induced outer membrane protein YdiY
MKLLVPLLLALSLVPFCNAADVRLRDGTVVYGTILNMLDGDDLVVDTAHMDVVTIEWEAVLSIDDTEVVEIEMYDGSKRLGTVSLKEGNLLVNDGETLIANRSDVFAISEVNDTFDDRVSAYTDFGTNLVRGNSRVSQLSLGAGVTYDANTWKTSLRATSIVNEQTNAENTRRLTLNADYDYELDKGWHALAYYQFESDEQQSLDGRSLFGGGFAKRLLNRRQHRLEALGGLAFNVEEFDGEPRNESTEAFLGLRYTLRWKLDSALSYIVYPSLDEGDRIRTEFNGSLSFDLLSDLDFRLIVYDRYDSDPPLGNKNNDTGLTMGLRWDY